jgi:hypothetical protein
MIQNTRRASRYGGWVHHLGDRPNEGLDTGRLLATTEDPGAVHIKGRQVGPCPATRVLVFDAGGTVRVRARAVVAYDPPCEPEKLVREVIWARCRVAVEPEAASRARG